MFIPAGETLPSISDIKTVQIEQKKKQETAQILLQTSRHFPGVRYKSLRRLAQCSQNVLFPDNLIIILVLVYRSKDNLCFK